MAEKECADVVEMPPIDKSVEPKRKNMMGKGLTNASRRLSTWMEIVAAAALVVILVLTGVDIVGRAFGHPVPGTYEVVSFAGGLVIGLAIPVTSRQKGHVMVDLVTARLPRMGRLVMKVIVRLLAISLFILLCYATIKMGMQLKSAGEVTPVLSLPFYPVAYAMGGAFVVECLVLACDMFADDGE
jgi:TRAP-type C4-dicarboxylate transport system permease small subunit